MALQSWLIGLLSAFGIKLSSSIDDVVWLAPFLTANASTSVRIRNSIIYMGVCLCQTVVAMVIAYSGRHVVRALTGGMKDAWSTEKILTVGAGGLLSLYSIKLTYEWIQECQGGGEEDAEENGNADRGSYAQVPTNSRDPKEEGYDSGRATFCCTNSKVCTPTDMEKAEPAEKIEPGAAKGGDAPVTFEGKSQEDIDKYEKERSRTLFVVAFIGSVDDLTLFVPMLVGKGFDFVQLMSGAFAATSLIITFCICLGMCKPIADCLSKIPLAVIVICFATILLLKAFVFDDDSKDSTS